MRLHNKGSKPVAYKIKTTNPKQYFVRPNQGIVQPGERKPIAVMMGKLPEMPTDKCKDKFLVQSIEYEGPIPEDGSDEKFDVRSSPCGCAVYDLWCRSGGATSTSECQGPSHTSAGFDACTHSPQTPLSPHNQREEQHRHLQHLQPLARSVS